MLLTLVGLARHFVGMLPSMRAQPARTVGRGAQLALAQADSPSGSWTRPVSCSRAAGAGVGGYLLFQQSEQQLEDAGSETARSAAQREPAASPISLPGLLPVRWQGSTLVGSFLQQEGLK